MSQVSSAFKLYSGNYSSNRTEEKIFFTPMLTSDGEMKLFFINKRLSFQGLYDGKDLIIKPVDKLMWPQSILKKLDSINLVNSQNTNIQYNLILIVQHSTQQMVKQEVYTSFNGNNWKNISNFITNELQSNNLLILNQHKSILVKTKATSKKFNSYSFEVYEFSTYLFFFNQQLLDLDSSKIVFKTEYNEDRPI